MVKKDNFYGVIDKILDSFLISGDQDKKISTAFEILSSSLIFERPILDIIENWWVGSKRKVNGAYEYSASGEDGKLDGFHIIEGDEIIIEGLQCKFSDKFSNSDITAFFESFKRYIIEREHVKEVNGYSDLSIIQDRIMKCLSVSPNKKVKYVVYISCMNIPTQKEKTLYDEFRRVFDGKLHLIEFKIISGDKLYKKVTDIQNTLINNMFEDVAVNLNIGNSCYETVLTNQGSEVNVLVGTLSGKSIVDMINYESEINIELKRLFNGNVRGFLIDSEINKEITRTLLNHPNEMLLKNNGLVILCDKFQDNSAGSCRVTNPIVINGQQSMCSIYLSRHAIKSMDAVKVPVKLIEVDLKKESNLVLEIAKSSNESNSIKKYDLLTNTDYINDLKKRFSEVDILLKIKDGELLNEIFIDSYKVVELEKILKLWSACVLNRLSYSKNLSTLINLIYKSIFSDYKYSDFFNDEIKKEKLISSQTDMIILLNEKLESEIEMFFKNKHYYPHGEYMIYNLLYNESRALLNDIPANIAILKDKFINIDNRISAAIEIEKEDKKNKNELYTDNNYFKSTRPLQHDNNDIEMDVSKILSEITS
ncbi:hypothetical protein G7062_08175 [Erysipelothrix sp. HDW6C]|uniref:AIPR family protein n=1 Tax=Erysipelothrix sp. HDW6C TaxID=2714930 RepID=UPI00140DD949|nr:AIPR family protein [Erysipelothrix sp. HDW6C]QIK70267.1 hypothetical protein G7062_08175 [Erysipelothrix sp. HDW6C]